MRVAAVTFVRKEFDLLPVWVKYYSNQVDEVYVINPGKDDYGDLEFNEIIYPDSDPDNHSIEQGLHFTNKLIEELLKEFVWVLVADADEFIVPDPLRYSGIKDYLSWTEKTYIRCMGWDVIYSDEEGPLDLEKPILEQRTKWTYSPPYNKSVVLREFHPLSNGQHYLEEDKKSIEGKEIDLKTYIEKHCTSDVRLIHLKRACSNLIKLRGSNFQNFDLNRDKAEIIPNYWKVI